MIVAASFGTLEARVFVAAGAVAGSMALIGWLRTTPSRRAVLFLAGLARLAAFPLEPTLSDDAFRYLWDGRVLVEHGESPYASTPDEQAALDPDLHARLNSPGLHSVYPPATQVAFAVAAAIGGDDWRMGWWVWKLILVAVEIFGIFLLSRVFAPNVVALYALHPVAILEVAGQGHAEGLFVTALAALVWTVSRRVRWIPAAVVAGVAAKLWPIGLLAAAGRRMSLAGWGLVLGGLAGVTLAMGWGGGGAGVLRSLSLYAGFFDWYAPLYLSLKALLWPLARQSSGALAARLLAIAWSAVLLAVAATDDGRSETGVRGVAIGVASYVLLSPVLHPWHLLPLLAVVGIAPSAARAASVWLVAWSAATYAASPDAALAYGTVLVIGWGGAVFVVLRPVARRWVDHILRRRALWKVDRLQSMMSPVEPSDRLLDLGGAEGHVAREAARRWGCGATVADIRPPADPGDAYLVTSPDAIPTGDQCFETTLLVFVLHHTEDPVATIREAARVSQRDIAVLESTYRWIWQKPLLQWIDNTVNGMRDGERMVPAHWRSRSEWRRLLDTHGFACHMGEVRGWLHPTVVFTVSSNAASPASSHVASNRLRSQVR